MLALLSGLAGKPIRARDGEIGKITQFFFDDRGWEIQYAVVDVGGWFSRREVLVSSALVQVIEGAGGRAGILTTNFSQGQLRQCPESDFRKPVSRQHELEAMRWYSSAYYWVGPAFTSMEPERYFSPLPPPQAAEAPEDPNLHSNAEVKGYTIEAQGVELASVMDFVADSPRHYDGGWRIRYLVVDTKTFWPSRGVLLPIDWVTRVSWNKKTVAANVDAELLRSAPVFYRQQPIDAETEARVYDHFKGRSLGRAA